MKRLHPKPKGSGHRPAPRLSSKHGWLGVLLAVLLTVSAQTIQFPNAPLSSVGRDAPWTNFEDNYRFTVFPEVDNTPVKLEIYSPDINLNDYIQRRDKTANFFGDEVYGPANIPGVRTTFTLTGADGSNLAQKTYRTSTEHRFDLLFEGTLAQGSYPLQALTEGKGKNGFSFRVSPGTKVEASQFSVVRRGQINQDQDLARILISKDQVGKTLRIENYDADGPREAQLIAVQPNGQRRILVPSGNTEWAGNNFRLTEADAGEWRVLVRILPSTKQHSNSIGLRISLEGKPLYVPLIQAEGPAPAGILEVSAVAQVCEQEVPLEGINFNYGEAAQSTTPAKLTLVPRSYVLQPQELPGATAESTEVTVAQGQTQTAKLVYQVVPDLAFDNSDLNLEAGQEGELGLHISTAFPHEVPYKLELSGPEGLMIEADGLEGTVSADKPAHVMVRVKAENAVEGIVVAQIAPNCAEASAQVSVTEPAAPGELTLEKDVQPSEAAPGDTVVYTLVVTNTGGSPLTKVRIEDPVAEGLEGQAIDETIDLEPGESRVFTYQSVVKPGAGPDILNTATATTEDGPNVVATATVSVKQPAVLALTRTPLSPNPALPGEDTKVCLQVKNTGGSAAEYTLTDHSTDLLEPAEAPSFSGTLEPGQTAEHCYPARTTAGDNAKTELFATLESPGLLNLTAATPFERVNLLLEKSTDTPVVRPGREARYQVTVTNPLQRTVVTELKGDSSLTLTPSETRTLTLNPGPNRFEVTGIPQEAGEYPNTIRVYINSVEAAKPATARVIARALPDRERETEVTVAARLLEAPTSGTVILSDVLPANAKYQMGSSRLLKGAAAASPNSLDPAVINRPTRENSDPIADPLISGNRLYWIVPGPLRSNYVLSYRLTHTEAIQLPADRLGVIVQVPQSRSMTAPRTPAGLPVLGSFGDLRLLSGEPAVLEAFLKAADLTENRAGASAAPAGGSAAEVMIYPARPLTTDKADQPELVVVVRDAQGRPANLAYLTVDITPEPVTPDAAPDQPGYQIKLQNGQGWVRLSNLGHSGVGMFTPGSPDAVYVRVLSDGLSYQAKFNVEATERPVVLVGSAGVQVNLVNFNTFSLEASINAFMRGNFGAGLLTGAATAGANWSPSTGFSIANANLLPPANPYDRFPLLGDGQFIGSDAPSSDCCFLRYEVDANYIQYGQMNAGFQGLLSGYSRGYNGLKGVLRGGALEVNGFLAVVPNANLGPLSIAGDGSSVYRLAHQDLVPNSDQVSIVVRNRDNPRLQTRTQLTRGVDYRIDYAAGVLELMAPLAPFDLSGNPQELELRYAIDQVSLQPVGGVQASFGSPDFGIKATFLQFDSTQPAFVGLGARFKAGAFSADVELGSSSAAFGLIGGAADLRLDTDTFDVSLRYQDLPPGYIDPKAGGTTSNPGKDVQTAIAWQPSGFFGLTGRYSLNQSYLDPARRSNAQVSLEGRLGAMGGLALLLGGGAGFDLTPANTNNFSTNNAYLSLGLEVPLGNLSIALRQLVGLGSPGATDLSIDYALNRNFGIRLQSRVWYLASGYYNQGALGVRGNFANSDLIRTLLGNSSEAPDPGADALGSTHIAATYELPNLAGDAGRSRVGLDTSIPLGSAFSLNLGANFTIADRGEGGASGQFGLRYADGNTTRASANVEVSGQANQPGLKTVFGVRGAFRLSDTLIVSPAGDYVRLASGVDGARFSLAAALRDNQFSILTNNLFRSGFYRAADGIWLEGEVRAGYQANEHFYLRLGGAYRLQDSSSATAIGQVGGGLTWFLNHTFGVGLGGSYLFDNAGLSQTSFGLEGSLRFADGWLFSLGINFLGTSGPGLGSFQSQPGLYARLDWKFDENTFGIKP